MQLSRWSAGWSPPRTWFVTARLLEVAAGVGVLGWVLMCWQAWQTTRQNFGPEGNPTEPPPFLDRVSQFATYGFGFGQNLFGGMLALLLVLAVVAILHFAQPVSHASLLRWEVLVLGAVTVLVNLGMLAAIVVALVRGDPNAATPGTVTFDTGPGYTELLISGAAAPVLGLVLMAAGAIWWLRLPADFEAPDDELDKPAREPRRWRPAPAPDANLDDLTLDGVELIEPVERLHPRSADEGSTSSGYDDYFRRF
ncbi:hypothetical protein SAMN04489867_1627 [Pedococcus dokdonensis]|uniref:Uncharacterized protein n=1 Tax=Pedococcus dokdonensis TaxID=443156 RepID=A0A1H0QJE3_9MICO|nr:hypothetical protein [Pedococcus dokdonensis]SDP17432.1 hypothetical protein SAMN04489867_1627 [Pedococcus dokdonensis]